jgi:hypothetical protein
MKLIALNILLCLALTVSAYNNNNDKNDNYDEDDYRNDSDFVTTIGFEHSVPSEVRLIHLFKHIQRQ